MNQKRTLVVSQDQLLQWILDAAVRPDLGLYPVSHPRTVIQDVEFGTVSVNLLCLLENGQGTNYQMETDRAVDYRLGPGMDLDAFRDLAKNIARASLSQMGRDGWVGEIPMVQPRDDGGWCLAARGEFIPCDDVDLLDATARAWFRAHVWDCILHV